MVKVISWSQSPSPWLCMHWPWCSGISTIDMLQRLERTSVDRMLRMHTQSRLGRSAAIVPRWVTDVDLLIYYEHSAGGMIPYHVPLSRVGWNVHLLGSHWYGVEWYRHVTAATLHFVSCMLCAIHVELLAIPDLLCLILFDVNRASHCMCLLFYVPPSLSLFSFGTPGYILSISQSCAPCDHIKTVQTDRQLESHAPEWLLIKNQGCVSFASIWKAWPSC